MHCLIPLLQVREGRKYVGKQVVAELLPAGDFYAAEEYHQQV